MANVTGFLSTDAMNAVDCPQCHQPAGKCCVNHKGRKLAAVHERRTAEYEEINPDRKGLYVPGPTQRERVTEYNRKQTQKKK